MKKTQLKSTLKNDWIILIALLTAEVVFALLAVDSWAIITVGVIWILNVVGFAIETTRFSDYYIKNYPVEYKTMLQNRVFKEQLLFSPANDSTIKVLQKRMHNYFVIVIARMVLPIVIFVISKIALNR